MIPTPRHQLPPDTDGDGDPGRDRWRYDQLLDAYSKPDPHFLAVCRGTIEGALLLLVAGVDRRRRTVSRGPDDAITLDTLSIGWAHWWVATLIGLLVRIANECEPLSRFAWGNDGFELVRDAGRLAAWFRETFGVEDLDDLRGKRQWDDRLTWLVAGWYAIARHPDVMRVQADLWLEKYAVPALAYCRDLGWNSARCLAAVARMRNSGAQRHLDTVRERHPTWSGERVCQHAMGEGYYGHPERWDVIMALEELDASLPIRLDGGRLNLTAPVIRLDGTVPVFPDLAPPTSVDEAFYARFRRVADRLTASCIAWPDWSFLSPTQRARVLSLRDPQPPE